MWLRRQNKKLFDLSVVAVLVALLTYRLVNQYWLWYYGDGSGRTDWLGYWREARANVGEFGTRVGRPLRVSSKLTRCLPEVNRFAAVAKPYNLEQIKRDDVIGADDEQVRWFMLETKTHEIYFLTNSLGQPRICSFQPKGINIAPLTEWDAPTGKWSEEEALAETLRIVKLLGMRFTMSRSKVYARERPLKNAPGVKVTPLYDVGLYGADGRLGVNAIFYVGETGPGRLVLWGVSDPDDW